MTVTHYEYDDGGRLVRSVSVPEPEWTPEDVALLVSSSRLEREVGPHGIPMSEATDPANQFAFEGHIRTDWAEKAKRDKLDELRKRDKDANLNGYYAVVSKRGG